MKAIERLLDRPLPIYMAALLFAVLGLWSAFQLPIKRNPQVEMPYVLVVVPYEGASAGNVEAEVTIELEEELNTLRVRCCLRRAPAETRHTAWHPEPAGAGHLGREVWGG